MNKPTDVILTGLHIILQYDHLVISNASHKDRYSYTLHDLHTPFLIKIFLDLSREGQQCSGLQIWCLVTGCHFCVGLTPTSDWTENLS